MSDNDFRLNLEPIEVENHRTRQRLSAGVAAAAVAAVLVAIVVWSVASAPDDNASAETEGQTGRTFDSSSQYPAPSTEISDDPTQEPEPEPEPQSGSPTDPPGTTAGADVKIIRSSKGPACSRSSRTDFGDYPHAKCKMWQESQGYLVGESVPKGRTTVVCQRDLGIDNPVYKQGQTNTWWVWMATSTGEFDWFPETAVAEGAPDQPINGIAVCAEA